MESGLSEFLVRARVRRALLLAGLVVPALLAGSALAQTTIGQTGTPITAAFSGGSEAVQTNAAMSRI